MWLVGPPSSVTNATTFAGSSSAVSAGARSRATSTNGSSDSGNARHRQAQEHGDRPVADVVEVGDPRGEVVAGAGQHLAEHPERLVHRARRRDALGDLLPGQLGQAGVAGHQGLGGQDVARLAAGLRAALVELGGDRFEGAERALPSPRRRRRRAARRGRFGDGAGDRADRVRRRCPG